MNKLFNWTFGSVFRTIGRVIGYLIVGALLGLILQKNGVRIRDLIPTLKVSASETVTTNLNKYYLRWCDEYGNNCSWSSSQDMGTSTSYSSSLGILDGVRGRFGSSSKFLKGVKYRVKLNVAFGNANTCNWYNTVRDTYCSGSLTSSWSSNADLIDSCQYVSKVCYDVDGNTRAHYYFDIVPNTDLYGFQVNAYFNDVQYINLGSVNVMSSSNVTYDRDTTDAINNSTTSIINNNNENTQQIINNQNELLSSECPNLLNFNNGNVYSITATRDDYYISTNYTVNLTAGKTYYIKFKSNKSAGGTAGTDTSQVWLLYNNQYNTLYSITSKETTVTPSQTGSYTIRLDCNKNGSTCTFYDFMISEANKPYCKYGSRISKQDETTNSINNLNDSINDDNVSSSQTEASNFFGNFTTNTHGLTGIITAPLNAINSLTSATCSPLVLPLPFVNQNLTLPCMREIYTSNFGGFMQIYDVIVIGIIAYWICVRIFGLVKDFKNPEHDEIEVVDL